MAFTANELRRIDRLVGRLCRRRSAEWESAGGRLEYDVAGHRVVVVEARPIWNEPAAAWPRYPVAKLTFVRKAAVWRLFWRRSVRKWSRYGPLPYSRELRTLLKEIDRDPHCCFFE